jgi:hypothetical protein
MNEEEERARMLVVSWLGDDGCGAISLEKDVTEKPPRKHSKNLGKL